MKQVVKYLGIFFGVFFLAGVAGYTGVTLFTRSAPEIVLPNFEGENIIDVLETLTRLGLNPKVFDTQYHDSIPKYGVSFQDPKPGAAIKKGRDVILYISKGFKEIQTPDLRQMVLKEGLITLETGELISGKILHVFSAQTLKGSIIAQYPKPFSKVVSGSRINLLVSKGPEPVSLAMPDLKELSLADALDRLSALSLKPGIISSRYDPLRGEGHVLEQQPEFGTRVLVTHPVHLVVNKPGHPLVADAHRLNQATLVSYMVPKGFSNRHVRVETDIFGSDAPLINRYMKPGKPINVLIPAGIKTKIRIFIDHEPVWMKIIDPWLQAKPSSWESWSLEQLTGEQKWE